MANNTIRLKQVKSPGNILQNEHQDSADAKRVILVDVLGNEITTTNPLPVDAVINLDITNPGTPEIKNVTLGAAGAETQIVIPEKTVRLKLRARNPRSAKLQISFEAGKSGTEFWTLMPGNIFPEEDLYLEGQSMFIQSPTPNVVVELIFWKP